MLLVLRKISTAKQKEGRLQQDIQKTQENNVNNSQNEKQRQAKHASKSKKQAAGK